MWMRFANDIIQEEPATNGEGSKANRDNEVFVDEQQITNDNEANDLLVKVRRPEFELPAI